MGLPLARSSAGNSTSCTSVDLPEPLTPVTQTRRPSGIADIDVLEIVLADALEAQGSARLRARRARRERRHLDALAPKQIVGGQGSFGAVQIAQRSVEHDFAAVLAGSGTDIEHPIRRLYHLRIVFNHDQGIAGVAQAMHDADDAFDVPRVQSNRWFIEHEQGIDQRGARAPW